MKRPSDSFLAATVRILLSPFQEWLPLFLVWWLLMTVPDVVYFVSTSSFPQIPFFLGRGFLIAYLLTAAYAALPTRLLRAFYAVVVYLLILCMFAVDLFCLVNMHSRFSYDMAGVIAGTNLNEAMEFLETYVDLRVLSYFLVALLVIVFVHCLKKNAHRHPLFPIIGCFLLAVSAFYSATNGYMLNGIYSKYHAFFEFPPLPDLRASERNLALSFRQQDLPQDVVVVIGESFTRTHSSLYGYAKETNPRLASLQADSCLFVFTDVESPAARTLQSFEYILNTYRLGMEDRVQMADCPTLPGVARHAGYKTYWVSNQSKHGQNDNLVGVFADLCDEEGFVSNKFSGLNRWSKDDECLPILQSFISDTLARRQCFFVHLMGSHFSFSARYPSSFSVFQESDYSALPPRQRQLTAEYDNSVLFNDYVVSQIIDMFRDRESVVVYFPDHGADVYESTDDWCGHLIEGDSLSERVSRRIPFVVYVSPRYRARFPQRVDALRRHVDTPYCTDKFIYTMMDLMGIRFSDNHEVDDYSLLSNHQ